MLLFVVVFSLDPSLPSLNHGCIGRLVSLNGHPATLVEVVARLSQFPHEQEGDVVRTEAFDSLGEVEPVVTLLATERNLARNLLVVAHHTALCGV